MKPFLLEILTPDKTLFWGEAQGVTVTAIDGELQILPGHMPYANVLPAGKILMRDKENKPLSFAHQGGVIEAASDKTSILITAGESLSKSAEG
ncbi:hypothetical protein HZB07_05105 [Candidatus Saganbacteria bacterium]|nr:hypothetical protein [Candidatus Saganbacteria bacterium]